MKKEKFPQTIAMAWKDYGTDDAYLAHRPTPEEYVEFGKKVQVGIYRLEKIVTVEGKAEVK